MEYISRVLKLLKRLKERCFKVHWQVQLQKFVSHYIWSTTDPETAPILTKLEARLEELREKRKNILKSVFKTTQSKRRAEVKEQYMTNFNTKQLEKMLRGSNINVSKELVGYLFNADGIGLLSEIQINQVRASICPGAINSALTTVRDADDHAFNVHHVTYQTLARFRKRKLRWAH